MNRLIAAVLALGATAAVALAVLLGTGTGAGGHGRSGPPQRTDPFCGELPSAGFDRPPNIAHSARYSNATYGYALTIPPGLIAYTSATAAPRGFGIVLSWQPRALLRVDAAYDVFYDITAAGVHLRDSVGVRLFDTLLQDHAQDYSLAGVSGGRYRMTLRCPRSAQTFVYESVIAVRDREIYRLDLQSVPQRYGEDVRVLDALLRTWSWVPLKQ